MSPFWTFTNLRDTLLLSKILYSRTLTYSISKISILCVCTFYSLKTWGFTPTHGHLFWYCRGIRHCNQIGLLWIYETQNLTCLSVILRGVFNMFLHIDTRMNLRTSKLSAVILISQAVCAVYRIHFISELARRRRWDITGLGHFLPGHIYPRTSPRKMQIALF